MLSPAQASLLVPARSIIMEPQEAIYPLLEVDEDLCNGGCDGESCKPSTQDRIWNSNLLSVSTTPISLLTY